MRPAGRSTVPFISSAWIGATSGRSLAAGEASLQRTFEPVRLEQEQRRDGLALSLKARARSTCSRSGKGAHINNVALGRHGRHRTNVWDYVSQNALNGTGKSKLALHPTVKPVAMIADAIRDCSNRGGLILDPFGGAGTTLIAAERTGRRARVIELNPIFVDVSIERWQRLTGGTALHADTGQPFARSASGSAAAIEG